MRFAHWIKQIDAVAKVLSKAMDDDQASHTAVRAAHFRQALADLSALFLAAPAEVDMAFRDLGEEKLNGGTGFWVDAFGDDRFRPDLNGDVHGDTLTMGGFVRALDHELASTLRDHFGPVADPEKAYQTPSGAAYVVPRIVPRPAGRRTQPFQKRGLRFNRVLPSEVAGLTVRLSERRVARTPAQAGTFGAALFENYGLKEITTDTGFLLIDVDCPDQLDLIRQQIAGAFTAGCSILAWPELMVPSKARERIIEELGATALEHGSTNGPDLVVAGTWHEQQDDGTWKNVGHVLSGAGKPLLRFEKVNKFYLRSANGERPEDIAIGSEIHILLTDFGAVSFCICKDFCDTTFPEFSDLDVDLFVVPSLGNTATMEGHMAKATTVNHRFGAKTFVVQQHIANPPEGAATPLGWVLAHTNFKRAVADLAQNTIWESY